VGDLPVLLGKELSNVLVALAVRETAPVTARAKYWEKKKGREEERIIRCSFLFPSLLLSPSCLLSFIQDRDMPLLTCKRISNGRNGSRCIEENYLVFVFVFLRPSFLVYFCF
jgi:hypothetical protein